MEFKVQFKSYEAAINHFPLLTHINQDLFYVFIYIANSS
jgi:hypothetical protein